MTNILDGDCAFGGRLDEADKKGFVAMTVREYVEKKQTLIGRIQRLWGVVFISSSPASIKLSVVILVIFFLIWLAVMIAIAPIMRLMLRCPRCHGVLLHSIFRRITPTPDFCPHCGLSLDEPRESPGNLA